MESEILEEGGPIKQGAETTGCNEAHVGGGGGWRRRSGSNF